MLSLRNFLWANAKVASKYCWKSWASICKHKLAMGLTFP